MTRQHYVALITDSENLYRQKKYARITETVSAFCKEMPCFDRYGDMFCDDDDPYLLCRLYALLVLSFIHLGDFKSVVRFMNLIFIQSGTFPCEYTGSYSPLAPDVIKKLLSAYDEALGAGVDGAAWGKACILHFMKKYTESEQLFEEAIRFAPHDSVALSMNARLLLHEFRYSEALRFAKKAVACSRPSPTAYLTLAFVCQKQFLYNQVQEVYDSALKIYPNDSRFYLQKGTALYLSGNSKAGIDWVRKAVAMQPENSKYGIRLVIVSKKTDEEKISMLDEIIQDTPFCNIAYWWLCDYSKACGKTARALEVARHSVSVNPYDEGNHVLLIELLSGKEQKDAIDTASDFCPLYRESFLLCQSNADGNRTDGIKICKAWYEKDPFCEDAMRNLLNFYKNTDLYYSFLKEISEKTNHAHYYIDDINLSLADTDKEKLVKKLSKIKKNMIFNATDYFRFFDTCLNLECFEAALEFIESALINFPTYNSFLYIHAAFLLGLGRNDAAIQILNSIPKSKNEDDFINSFSDILEVFSDEFDVSLFEGWYTEHCVTHDDGYKAIVSSSQDCIELRKLWFWQLVLLCLISYVQEGYQEPYISHYTRLDVLKILSTNLEEKNTDDTEFGKLRLTSISPANDMNEGKTLFDLFFDKMPVGLCSHKNTSDFVALQTSFTRNAESLTMLRFYGKCNEQEGTGVNLEFSTDFFSSYRKSPFAILSEPPKVFEISSGESLEKISNRIKKSSIEDEKLQLYNILYFDRVNKNLMFYPNLKYYPVIACVDSAHKVKPWQYYSLSSCRECSAKECVKLRKCHVLQKKNDALANNIEIVVSKIRGLLNALQNDADKLSVANILLLNIRFLIKDIAFVEEQELRIISVLKTTDVAIKTDGYKLYKDYIPMYCKGERGKTYLRKVVLGPKIENANVVKEYYDHIYKKCGFDIDVSISTAPLR